MTDISLPITTLLASSLLAWLLVLSWHVIKRRQSAGIAIGEGADILLIRRMRAQANLTEYAPLFLVLIAALELQGGDKTTLALLSIAFVLGRLAHGYEMAFTTRNGIGRLTGMLVTLGVCGFAVVYGVVSALI